VLIFFIAGLLYLLRCERVDNVGAYRIPPETGILIPSGYFNLSRQAYNPAMRGRLVQIVALGDNLLRGGQR